jgi:DNA-binding CsgD family transcriptional regulator
VAARLGLEDAEFARNDLAIANRAGLIVVDHSLNLVASNVEAIQVLTFPSAPEKIPHLEGWLTKRIRESLVNRGSPATLRFVGQFKSARRTYDCCPFPLNKPIAPMPSRPALVLLLERRTNGGVRLAEVCTRFGLTPREQATVRLLFEGLTTKEIGQRMKISPNTVKAFLRLVMVKMDVSTRSGIIGRIAGSNP